MVGGAAIIVLAGAKKSFLCKLNHLKNLSKKFFLIVYDFQAKHSMIGQFGFST